VGGRMAEYWIERRQNIRQDNTKILDRITQNIEDRKVKIRINN
jgi:hypothetical protein